MVAPLLIAGAMALAKEFLPGMVKHIAGDKAGEVAQSVVDVAQSVTGTSSPDDALVAMQADPSLVIDYKKHMASVQAELDKAYLVDRQNARDRDVKLKQAGYHNYRADIMLTLAFVCVVALVYFLWEARLDMPDQVFAALNMALGMLLKMIGDAFQFEFGSSRGSKEKDMIGRQ
ncbi:hypothetical protein [Thalassospira marina]|uniref:TMhelix containing protein n=1 Tax=Thalassospira marina TaxID=2048283 RepID=A0A2N3KXV3_9PROT|nr:hypothetical protein [Thalassospira marina]PKR55394.1 hypothetical protein COO20_04280 [Thalassospira marina]